MIACTIVLVEELDANGTVLSTSYEVIDVNISNHILARLRLSLLMGVGVREQNIVWVFQGILYRWDPPIGVSC